MPAHPESFWARSRKNEQNEVALQKTHGSFDTATGPGRGQLPASMLLLLLLLRIKQTEEHSSKNMEGRQYFRYETRPQTMVWDRKRNHSLRDYFRCIIAGNIVVYVPLYT
jgi:hypothetical protein